MFANIKQYIIQSILIILISVLSGVSFNAIYSKGLPLIYRQVDIQAGSVIPLEETRYLFLTARALFIDARSAENFRRSHIKNALNLPYRSPRGVKIEILKKIPKERTLIVYCQNAQCTLAERLARQLLQLGYKQVSIFAAGLDAWAEAGLPLESEK